MLHHESAGISANSSYEAMTGAARGLANANYASMDGRGVQTNANYSTNPRRWSEAASDPLADLDNASVGAPELVSFDPSTRVTMANLAFEPSEAPADADPGTQPAESYFDPAQQGHVKTEELYQDTS